MDIVVCGAHVPYMRGGAELHMENLVNALEVAGHRADLVRLPVVWDRKRILDAPLAWRLLPIDADVVIATNFPSYFVRHPRKVVWLFHQHRSAYDAVDSPWSDFGLDPEALATQRLLSEWDARALEEATQIYTTSRVVADRLARFNGVEGAPLYHPPPLHDRLGPGPFDDYVLCVSRLEANKRPELLVEGVASSSGAVRGVLAGSGSMETALRATVKRLGAADRVELLGFVPDDRLVELYRSCLAVVYAPHDEDYGYGTLQAFCAGKPVITASDSGGVLEWVEDGVTGIVTDGGAAGVASAIDSLAADRELARRMGEAGRQRVENLGWERVVERLLAR
ncbi:MAG TPA: glycosyltransferase family 4 protein [Thermoleophilaceae bacterium]